MSRINNTHKSNGDGTTTVFITKNDDVNYLKEVIVDDEDLKKIDKIRIQNNGYAYNSKSEAVSHIVMGHKSNMNTVVDHINGDKFDNRKTNLRVLTQKENSSNINKTKSNVGIPGIAKRENGNYKYFRASVSDLKTTNTQSGEYKGKGNTTKRISKQFNINKLGEEEALSQAKNWLRDKRAEFGYKN